MTAFPPLPVLGDLTEPEQQLIEAARQGRSLVSDGEIRAEVLRELLLGRRGPLDPRGVRVEGARVTGELDLSAAEAVTGLGLVDCTVTGPFVARHATLPWLDLSGSKLGTVDLAGARITAFADFLGAELASDSETALDAEGLVTDDLRLSRTRIRGAVCLLDARVTGRVLLTGAEITSADGPAIDLDHLEAGVLVGVDLRARGTGPLGAVRAIGAHVSHEAGFDRAELANESGPALVADRLVADENLSLVAVRATGAVRLPDARIGGQLMLGKAVLTNESGRALSADGLQCGDLYMDGLTATAAGADAAISLTTARIGGQLGGVGAVVANSGGRGLSADGMRVEDSITADGLKARGSGEEAAALSLIGAYVGESCSLDDAELANDTGAAFSGDRLRVGGNVHLRRATASGAVRLLSARIEGELYLEGARIANDDGGAIQADRLRVGRSMDLTDAHVTGAGDDGALRMLNSEVTGQLRLARTEVTNASGPGFVADDLRVGTYLTLGGLKATCSSEIGALSLDAARIDGTATFDGAVVTNDRGPALFADRCVVRDSLRLTGLRAAGAGEGPTIRLLGARVGGQLDFTGAELTHSGHWLVSLEDAVVDGPVFLPAEAVGRDSQVDLDGFRFGALGGVTWQEWLDLVRFHTPEYRPGPYQQLAAAERSAGHDGNVRRILIAQQRDRQRRAPDAIGGWLARRFHGLWGVFAAYGYRARRTAAALLLALIAAGGLGLWAGHVGEGGHRAAERVTDFTAATGTPCTTVELIGVGLDRGLPLSPGVRGRCDLNTGTGVGQLFTVAIWLVQAAVWALATLALVGYTGLVRKTG